MLYLIAGHGDGDPGAVCNGIEEQKLNRLIAHSIFKQAEAGTCKILDESKDHYKEQTLKTANYITAKDWVLEIHMDAYSSRTAKGGHVIIWKGYEPDKYDKALEEMIKKYLPGRAVTMVKRGDLFNPNTAAARNINYRLVEFGFITNDRDREFVMSHADVLGKRVCEIFGIAKKEETKPIEEKIDKWMILNEKIHIHVDKIKFIR